MVTTIIFDLSEVYIHGMQGIEERITAAFGTEVTNDLYLDEASEKLFHGKITEDEYWQALIDKYKWKVDVESLKRLIRENMTEVEGTREIIEKLKENGYTLGLLSIHAKEWVLHCEKIFNYHKLFKLVMYSYEVGVSKPERKAFELILEKLNANPKECIFIDDSERNIAAASSLGMHVIRFETPKQLRKDLRKMQIKL